MENKFYVYVHFNKQTGDPFYVGKGQKRRAYNTSKRSKYWKSIVSKYGYEIEIIEQNLSEIDSFNKEIYWIAQFKVWGFKLANMTDGGDGIRTGYKFKKIDGVKRKYNRIAPYPKGMVSPFKNKHHTEEAKKIQKEKAIGRPSGFKGKSRKHTDKELEKMRIKSTGRTYSDERNDKIKKFRTGKKLNKITRKYE